MASASVLRMHDQEAFQVSLCRSAAMLHAISECHLYANSDRTVALVGPVGVGKTALAKLLHGASGRPGDLVTVAAGELVESLYASTLFGHVRGAFTGADRSHEGVFEVAGGGSLLIDDFANLSAPPQSGLLRAMEEGRYRPLGARVERVVECRVIIGSTLTPRELAAKGRMLPDLASRMGRILIRVPALRDRREDIMPLALSFARTEIARKDRLASVTFSEAAVDRLLKYDWPWNVRELRDAMRFAIPRAAGPSRIVIQAAHLPDEIRFGDAQVPPRPSSAPPRSEGLPGELGELLRALEAAGGNKSEAARMLSIHRNTLTRRLKRLRAG